MKKLDRSLGFPSVVAISIGAMLGSGIFVLPGLAAAKTGASVWLAYVIAGLCALPAALSKAELSTAMPTSGGTYIYIDRAFGPFASTIAGLGLWFSLLLKSAFALIGFGAYLTVITQVPLKLVALVMLVAIVILNVIGTAKVSKVQIITMVFALGVLAALVAMAMPAALASDIFKQPQLSHGFDGLMATAAFVFISFAGVTKAAAVAGEVKQPERNLPAGIILSLVLVTIVYGLVTFVMSAVIPEDTFMGTTRPVYDLAFQVGGAPAAIVGAVLGIITMVSMANSGLLASSRFPFAMSRDQLLPPFLGTVSQRYHTPVAAVLFTAIAMAVVIVVLDVERLAKLASAFVLMIYIVVNSTVIIMRESSPQWYKPAYRSPLYPLTQIMGILTGLVLLFMMFQNAIAAIVGTALPGTLLFLFYGRKRAKRMGELLKLGPRPDLVQEREGNPPPPVDTGVPGPVLVALFGNERSPETIVEMGMALADERRLVVQHVTEIQESEYEDPSLDVDPPLRSLGRRLRAMSEDKGRSFEFSAVASRDVTRTVHRASHTLSAECLVLAWGGRVHLGRMLRNPLAWLLSHMPCNLALFRDSGVRYVRKIMVFAEPGPHDSLVASTADHLASLYNAELTFVLFAADDLEAPIFQSQVDYLDELRHLCRTEKTDIRIVRGGDLFAAIGEETTFHDLLVLGAPPEKGLLGFLRSSAEDRITNDAACSVLQLRTPRVKTHTAYRDRTAAIPTEGTTILNSLANDCIEVGLTHTRKDVLFAHFAAVLAPCVPGATAVAIEKALWDREDTQNTAVGHGLALPHATIPEASKTVLAVFTTERSVNYAQTGGEPVDVFFVTLGPPSARQSHLELLSNVAQLVLQTDLLKPLRAANTATDVIAVIEACTNQINGNDSKQLTGLASRKNGRHYIN